MAGTSPGGRRCEPRPARCRRECPAALPGRADRLQRRPGRPDGRPEPGQDRRARRTSATCPSAALELPYPTGGIYQSGYDARLLAAIVSTSATDDTLVGDRRATPSTASRSVDPDRDGERRLPAHLAGPDRAGPGHAVHRQRHRPRRSPWSASPTTGRRASPSTSPSPSRRPARSPSRCRWPPAAATCPAATRSTSSQAEREQRAAEPAPIRPDCRTPALA